MTFAFCVAWNSFGVQGESDGKIPGFTAFLERRFFVLHAFAQKEPARLLSEAGAKLNEKNNHGSTALQYRRVSLPRGDRHVLAARRSGGPE